MFRRNWLTGLAALWTAPLWAKVDKPKFQVLLAQNYAAGLDVSRYWVSEKFDGVRAFWDGSALRFRSGGVIAAPAWFLAKLPKQALDGELWLARGKFDELSGMVRKAVPEEADWQRISYFVFELPGNLPTFTQRVDALKALVAKTAWPQLQAVAQTRVRDEVALKAKLSEVVKSGGEGLMLHLADAPYVVGRNAVLLKLKPTADAEAKVIKIEPGKSKHEGRMGALWLQTEEGIRFKLGTGFSDQQRQNPPPIGAWVTYTYRDLTPSGKPRFASFVQVRELP